VGAVAQRFLSTDEVVDLMPFGRDVLQSMMQDTPPDYSPPWANVSTGRGRQARYIWTPDLDRLLDWAQAVEAWRSGEWPALTDGGTAGGCAGGTRTDPSDSTPRPPDEWSTSSSPLPRRPRTADADGDPLQLPRSSAR